MKSFKLKKCLAALLAAGMLLSLTACIGASTSSTASKTESKAESTTSEENLYYNKEGYPICDKEITLKVTGALSVNSKDWNKTIMNQYIAEHFGIKLDCNTYSEEDWPTQLTFMLASNELPDLVLRAMMASTDIAKYGADGYLLDFSKYADLMPNLAATYKEYPELQSYLTQSDGEVFGFASINGWTDATIATMVAMNETWLEKVGLARPTTLDELYTALCAFRDQDANNNGDPNDEIPMGYASNGMANTELPILWAYDIYGRNYTYNLAVDDKGTVSLSDTSDNYKAFLKYMHQLYMEKLINQDAYVIAGPDLKQKVLAGSVGYFGNSSSVASLNLREDWYIVNGFTSDYNKQQVSMLTSRLTPTYTITASANTEYPEAIARLVDYFYSDEGALSSENGWEGLTFSFKTAKGYEDFGVADHQDFYDKANFESYEPWRQQVAMMHSAFTVKAVKNGTIFNLLDNCKTEDLLSDDVWNLTGLNALRELALRDENVKVMTVPFPVVSYTGDESSTRATLYTDINNYLKQAKAQFIDGEVDIDAGWDAYLAELQKMGINDLLKIEQAAYDRYSGK